VGAGRLALGVAAVCAALLAATLVARAAEDRCSLYVYLDGEDMLVRTVRLADVPADKRESLLTYRDCAAAKALRAAGGQERKAAPEINALAATGGALPTADSAAVPGGGPEDGWRRWGWLVRVRMLPVAQAAWLYASAAAALMGLLGLLLGAIGRRPLGAAAACLALGLLSGAPALSVLLLDGWPF